MPKTLKSVKVNLKQGSHNYLYAWGDNSLGKLGIDSKLERVPRATLVTGIEETVVQVACGALHTLCLTKSGRVY